jgi:hypothetical protein
MNLHSQLAEALGALRDAEDHYKLVKATAEQNAIDHGCEGKNEAERGRKLTLAIAGDVAYARALYHLRQAEQTVDRLKAAIATADDDQQAYRWSIRAALVEALGGSKSEPFDGAMDAVVDKKLDEVPYVAFCDGEPLPDDWFKHD